MLMAHHLQKWQPVSPTEHNGFCIFSQDLEEDPLVFFHTTPKRHLDAIATVGFRSAAALGTGTLTSVSYAKKSSACLAHIGNPATDDHVVFAVRFDSLDQKGLVVNISDIHVYDDALQPRILGYCELPNGFRLQ